MLEIVAISLVPAENNAICHDLCCCICKERSREFALLAGQEMS